MFLKNTCICMKNVIIYKDDKGRFECKSTVRVLRLPQHEKNTLGCVLL